MSKFNGIKKAYYIIQKNESGLEQPISYQVYNGSFVTMDTIENSTPFEYKQQALDLAKIQTLAEKILKNGFEYYVLESVIERKVVSEEPVEEPVEEPTEEPVE